MRPTLALNRRAFGAALVTVLLAVAGLGPVAAQDAEPFIQVIPRTEIGYVAVLKHLYQSGDVDPDSTRFNYLTQGGQDILFPYQRYAADIVLGGRHIVTLLYQPLTFNTQTVVDRNGSSGGDDIVIDGLHFTPGTELDLKYGFDFWRASYLYDFARSPDTILGAGLSLQIRNASIVFSSADGLQRTVQQNIGPVPILKFRAAHQFSPRFGLDFEADGFYASSAFFNGSSREFKGWVWDAALSATTTFVPGAKAFLVVRSIGGGAEGYNAYDYTSSTTSSPGSYTYNELATLALSLGFSLQR
jgi:hypothetical protein